MAAYLVVDIEVTNRGEYEEYKKLAAETVHRYGGRYLVRGGTLEVLEGDWIPRRLVVVEFPSMERAKEWYLSKDYEKAREIRNRTARSRAVLVEGS